LSFFCPNFQIQRKPKTVLMTGKMSYHANTSAALYLLNEIMPLVWAQQPEAQLQLVGSSPPKALQAFAQRDPQRVQVTGFVPELQPYLWQATVAVVPILYGAGSQFKVLEALATATPTVVSPQAGNALSAQPGVDLLQAATPTEFAAAILQVFDKRELQQQLAQNGRQYVQAAHDWQAIAQQLLEIYHDTFRSVI
jgi:glycosyltransferase involved in cell wall biosynthesis